MVVHIAPNDGVAVLRPVVPQAHAGIAPVDQVFPAAVGPVVELPEPVAAQDGGGPDATDIAGLVLLKGQAVLLQGRLEDIVDRTALLNGDGHSADPGNICLMVRYAVVLGIAYQAEGDGHGILGRAWGIAAGGDLLQPRQGGGQGGVCLLQCCLAGGLAVQNALGVLDSRL